MADTTLPIIVPSDKPNTSATCLHNEFLDLISNILNIIPNDNYNKRLMYLKELLPAKKSANLVFVFIDNTNICKQGKKKSEHVSLENIHTNYGRLLKFVLNGQEMGDDPVIAGSPFTYG
ncbi:hypothetical protein C1645_739694 [Glomus cerebriforme]|uniref:Uncharacterized protein n=1 Tax=Glomus cerebriforme TaxID=658196 RepID=A0A397STW5_9GLOM|nr:hypothetical protein C1645_739694 [Glomus cerebriforme]